MVPRLGIVVEEDTSSHHPERQLGLPSEEMAVFGDKDFCADPLGIGRNERIGRLQPFSLIPDPQLKRYDTVLVDGGPQERQQCEELLEGFGG